MSGLGGSERECTAAAELQGRDWRLVPEGLVTSGPGCLGLLARKQRRLPKLCCCLSSAQQRPGQPGPEGQAREKCALCCDPYTSRLQGLGAPAEVAMATCRVEGWQPARRMQHQLGRAHRTGLDGTVWHACNQAHAAQPQATRRDLLLALGTVQLELSFPKLGSRLANKADQREGASRGDQPGEEGWQPRMAGDWRRMAGGLPRMVGGSVPEHSWDLAS